MPERGIEKIFSAMKVNKSFASSFLNKSTRQAIIDQGYKGETFNLTEEELSKLMALGSYQSPEEFAQALLEIDN